MNIQHDTKKLPDQEQQGGFSLLIADDEQTILENVAKYIKKNTTKFRQVYSASDGRQALDFIFRCKPTVMLIDIQMPGKTGLEVMRDAQAAGVCPKTIILSGYDNFSYAQQALRMGASDYMLKPCRSSELLQKLESLVSEEIPLPDIVSGGQVMQQAVRYCREHMDEDIRLNDVATEVCVNSSYLSRLFSKHAGGFVDYLNKIRIDAACGYIREGNLKLYEIAYKVGFSDEKYFSKVFKRTTGQSPSEYRAQLSSNIE